MVVPGDVWIYWATGNFSSIWVPTNLEVIGSPLLVDGGTELVLDVNPVWFKEYSNPPVKVDNKEKLNASVNVAPKPFWASATVWIEELIKPSLDWKSELLYRAETVV